MSSKVLRGGERKRRRRRRRRERGAKGVALQTSPATCRHPGVTGLFPGLPEKGRLELGPTGIRVLCQEEVISLQSSAQAEAFRPNPCVQDRGIRKTGRREGPRRGQREGRGERSIKSLVPYQSGHSDQLSASGGDQGQKGPSCGCWVWSIGRQAGLWVPRVVRMSVSAKRSPHQLQEGGPLPGPVTELL